MFGWFKKKPDISAPKLKQTQNDVLLETSKNNLTVKTQRLIDNNRADLDYLVENLDLFADGNGNLLPFYWFRSHPEELDNELLCYEVPFVNVGAPETISEKLVALNGPNFSSSEQANLAFELVVKHVIEDIESKQNRVNFHPDDLPVYECCRHLKANFDAKSLENALKSEDLAFKSRLEATITNLFIKETAHLYQLLDKKKPYIRSKFIRANQINYDEFGEPEQSDMFDAVCKILKGINLEDSYEDRFRLFDIPWEGLVPQAVAYMSSWRDDVSSETAPIDGFEFEKWVADRLNDNGWVAYATQGSGDQGVDVIATREDMTIGIQCKRYSGSVGNKAVQEIYAGAQHMGLERSVVVSNSKYTKSAIELAKTTGTLLISDDALSDLFDLLKH